MTPRPLTADAGNIFLSNDLSTRRRAGLPKTALCRSFRHSSRRQFHGL